MLTRERLWIRIGPDNYLPVHEIDKSMEPSHASQCSILPFIHSLSGRDTTSLSFFIGKKTWMSFSKKIEIDALKDFAESKDCFLLTEAVKNPALVNCCIHKTAGQFGK